MIEHCITIEERNENTYSATQQATCSCGWKGEKLWIGAQAQADSHLTDNAGNLYSVKVNPTYAKLRRLIWEALYPGEPMYAPSNGEIQGMYRNVEKPLDAIWPAICDLMADEYDRGKDVGWLEGSGND